MIYVIAEPDNSFVKIGFTSGHPHIGDWAISLLYRLGGVQNGNPRPLKIVAVTAGSLKTERALHREHSAHRLRLKGEWFTNTGSVAEFILKNEISHELVLRLDRQQRSDRVKRTRLRKRTKRLELRENPQDPRAHWKIARIDGSPSTSS